MERYRSGHTEAVLKTVCLHGHMGSNPILSVLVTIFDRDRQSAEYPASKMLDAARRGLSGYGSSTILLGNFDHGEVPKLAEGAPLERE